MNKVWRQADAHRLAEHYDVEKLGVVWAQTASYVAAALRPDSKHLKVLFKPQILVCLSDLLKDFPQLRSLEIVGKPCYL